MRPDEEVYKEYNCDGATTSFPITFTFDDEEEVHCWIRNVSLKTQSQIVNPDDFHVEGKNLITVDTWDEGYKLIMIRATEQSQTLYLEEYGHLPSVLVESRLDKLTAMVQELQRNIGGRAILLPETYIGDPIAFPEPKDKHFLGWIGEDLVNKQHVAGTATVPADTIHEVGEVGEPTFENSWANEGDPYAKCGFYKDVEKMVHLQGSADGGPPNTIAWTLPVGKRPSKTMRFPVVSEASCHIEINASGEVKVVA